MQSGSSSSPRRPNNNNNNNNNVNNSNQPDTLAGVGLEAVMDNFCVMLVEEYLTKRNLHSTLNTFRRENGRLNEVSI